jgi:glycosyltransferase involved in cell wall biosynthesis
VKLAARGAESLAHPDVMSHKPRIALVGHTVSEQLFGAERSLLSVVAAIDRSSYEIFAVFPRHNEGYMNAVRRYADDVEVFPYQWLSQPPDGDVATISRFIDLFRSWRIDLVHVNTITLVAPLLAARQLTIPSIVHARELIDQDDDLAGLLGHAPADIIARILAAGEFIIANSDTTHRLYRKARRSFRLYNCIDIDAFEMANDVAAGPLKVGIISNNHPKKGLDDFIKLALLAAARGAALAFVVIGPHTDYTEELELRLKREGSSANVRFLGYLSDPVEAMRQVNVVVSLSAVAESFGRTLAEAMAARRPVIAYDRGAAPEIVQHEVNGFIIPPSDIARALTHLETLADNRALLASMGEAGRARAEELFAPAAFAKSLNAIYGHILETWQRTGR